MHCGLQCAFHWSESLTEFSFCHSSYQFLLHWFVFGLWQRSHSSHCGRKRGITLSPAENKTPHANTVSHVTPERLLMSVLHLFCRHRRRYRVWIWWLPGRRSPPLLRLRGPVPSGRAWASSRLGSDTVARCPCGKHLQQSPVDKTACCLTKTTRVVKQDSAGREGSKNAYQRRCLSHASTHAMWGLVTL